MEDYQVDSQTAQPASDNQPDVVSDALKVYRADEKGKVVIPDGTPPHVVTALKLEQQRRNSNSNYGKERARADRLEAENEALKANMGNLSLPTGPTAEQLAELEELKYSNPDEWYKLKTEIDKLSTIQANTRVTDAVAQASKDADTAYTAKVAKGRDESLSEMLTTHNTLNPDGQITQEMLNQEIPPSIVTKYHLGELTGTEFLASVSKFLYAGRVIKTEKTLGQPNIGSGNGSSTPPDEAKNKSLEELYSSI